MEFISNFQNNSECEIRTIIIKKYRKVNLLACTKSSQDFEKIMELKLNAGYLLLF